MASVAENLNNAIHSLAFLNPSTPAAVILNDHWSQWWDTHRLLLPDAAWWSVFKGFWIAYAAARATAPVVSARTPPAADIDPSQWDLVLEAAKASGQGVRDLPATLSDVLDLPERLASLGELGREIRREIGDAAKAMLFVSAVAGLALWMMRGRR